MIDPEMDVRPPRGRLWMDLARVSAAGILLKAGCLGSLHGAFTPPPLSDLPPAVWATNTLQAGASAGSGSASIPIRPLEGQETDPARCTRAGTYIYGGCWVRLHMPPPCEPGTFLYKGACYIPLQKAQRPPVASRG